MRPAKEQTTAMMIVLLLLLSLLALEVEDVDDAALLVPVEAWVAYAVTANELTTRFEISAWIVPDGWL